MGDRESEGEKKRERYIEDGNGREGEIDKRGKVSGNVERERNEQGKHIFFKNQPKNSEI